MLFLLLPALAHAFTVESFAPQGLVKAPRQARARFSEAMVPFGDPRHPAPFAVTCGGKGVWEDSRTWTYELELASGARCRFQPVAGFSSASGGKWEKPGSYELHTGAPAILIQSPYAGHGLEERPAFFLGLEGPVDLPSVERNAYLLVEGLPERIPLRILPAKLRDEMGRQSWEYGHDPEKYFPLALESTRALPAGKKVKFVWGKGIRSASGIAQEQDHVVEYAVRPPFRADFSCRRENASSPCIPVGAMSVSFSAAIAGKDAAGILLRWRGGVIRPAPGREEWRSYVSFNGPFPPREKFTLELPRRLRDESGRPLANAGKFPLELRTGAYPPLAKFSGAFGILEARDAVLPVTLRNVEERVAATRITGARLRIDDTDPARLIQWIRRLHAKEERYAKYGENGAVTDRRGQALLAGAGGAEAFALPKPNGPEAFEVVGIPLGKKGFHVVELGSELLGAALLGERRPMYVAAGALVTDLGVHLKWGSEGSLVWVTSLERAAPVDGAEVRVTDCAGQTVWAGRTGADGAVATDRLPKPEAAATCAGEDYRMGGGLFVFARKGDDFSFTHSGWDDGIELWRFQVPYAAEGEGGIAHTVFDRTLLRAGQTVHMRHLLREKFLRGLRLPRELPRFARIRPPGGEEVALPLRFDASGGAESEWKIPESAGLGTYEVYLSGGGKQGFPAGSFRVEDFRPPILAGSIQWPPAPFVAPGSLAADLSVRYLSGGGAAALAATVRSRVEKLGSVSFPDFEDFVFANGGVRPGRVRRAYAEEGEAREQSLSERKVTLDENGTARVNITDLPSWDQPAELTAEAEYRDPNGEVQTIARRARLFPGPVLVGFRSSGWAAPADRVRFTVAAVDPLGRPRAGAGVEVRWAERRSFSHRKRIVGGFYAYENFDETRLLGAACGGKTDERGLLECEVKAPASGRLVLVAETGEAGRVSRANQEVWVAGAGDWWFPQENDDRVDLLPERKRYEPGETARFQVRTPFREATALVTVEREGVIEHFVRKMEAGNPVIEVPVKDSYAPNVFVSALLVRGRTEEPRPTALVDLARPAHKLGLGEIRVGWKAHELKVSVTTDREEYRVRDRAKVKVRAQRASDGRPAAGGTVTLVAVDEALLELRDNRSWDLLEAMMESRSLHVRTATAQSRVVGRRHFGLKALPAGGGGGRATTRELFDTLLFWKAALPLDSRGEAEAEIPLGDSLSSFRVVAVAAEGLDRFGKGERSVRTRQDLLLFSGVAPLARYGDHTRPEVTVRNGGAQPLQAEVSARVEDQKPLPAQTVRLAPGESKVVSWPLVIPEHGDSLEYSFAAEGPGDARDALKVRQRLEPALRVSTVQSALERIDAAGARFPASAPAGAVSGQGGVGVFLRRRLAESLGAMENYMDAYPYGCLEQRVSKAVALGDGALWEEIGKSLPAYIDGDGLLKYFPEALHGSDVLTSYVLSIAPEAGMPLPAEHLPRLVRGLQDFVEGKLLRRGFEYPAADLGVRKLAALNALSRHHAFAPGMLAPVAIEPELWPPGAQLDWWNLLAREPGVPDRERRLRQIEQLLRARLEWRGATVGFRAERPLWWLMSSGDVDAARFLLAAVEDPRWQAEAGRLVRGVLARQRRGAWDLTTANAWGRVAVGRFSEKFEREKVAGKTTVAYGPHRHELAWKPKVVDGSVEFPWQPGTAEVSLRHEGAGNPWALIDATAAVRLREPIFKGYRLERTLAPVRRKRKGRWSVGDIYRVRLTIDAAADMTWVAVTDPVPAGATILGSGLGHDSSLATAGEKHSAASFTERGFSAFRSYFEWLPRGRHRLEYTVRLNASGTFGLPNSRVEAMYAPESYAERPNAALTVAP